MKAKPIKGRALRPDPNKSLFKFKLTWAILPDGTQPKSQTWYSYDYSCERQMFPEGLNKELRFQWKKLLQDCWKNPELYEHIKWLRPHVQESILQLYLPNWPGYLDIIRKIEMIYGWVELSNAVKTSGFTDFCFQAVKPVHPRQPGNSPGRKDYTQYYGFKYLHRNDFIIKNLDTGKLLKVDVYDNLMYHSENYLYSLITRQLVRT
jgi:hypothetical protein